MKRRAMLCRVMGSSKLKNAWKSLSLLRRLCVWSSRRRRKRTVASKGLVFVFALSFLYSCIGGESPPVNQETLIILTRGRGLRQGPQSQMSANLHSSAELKWSETKYPKSTWRLSRSHTSLFCAFYLFIIILLQCTVLSVQWWAYFF